MSVLKRYSDDRVRRGGRRGRPGAERADHAAAEGWAHPRHAAHERRVHRGGARRDAQRPAHHLRLRYRAQARDGVVGGSHDRRRDGHGHGRVRHPHPALPGDAARGRPHGVVRDHRTRRRGARLAHRRSRSCRSSAARRSRGTPSTTCASEPIRRRATPPSSGRGKVASPGSPSSRFSGRSRAGAVPSAPRAT